ncbi:MAG: ABC transporter permease [Vicinamibacterales bacterium]
MDEIRLAVRRLRKRPGATIASIVTLACGIGAAAATWSLLSAVLLRPLPVEDPERLVVVGQSQTDGRTYNAFNYPYYPHFRDTGVFEHAAAEWTSGMSLLVATHGLPAPTRVTFVSHNYFDVLGIRIPLGRGFTADDDRRGAPPVALLTDRYWRRAFDASPGVLGRTLTVAGKPVIVVGVAARGFRGLNLSAAPEVILPFHVIADVGPASTNYFAEPSGPGTGRSSPTAGVAVIGRLKPGTTAAQSAAQLSGIGFPPALTAGRTPTAGQPGPQFVLTDVNTAAIPEAARAGMTQFSKLLGATVSLLLLIGCATVGMLLLVRTEARRDEFAMCLALGATRARLARGIGIEGAILAVAGATCALPVAWWLFAGARAFQLPGGVQIDLLELSLDVRVVGVAVVAALVATLLITIVAGAFGFSANLSGALRSRAGATPRLGRRRTRAALVGAQVAVALVLLAGAGLFTRSLIAALNVNPGFDAKRLVSTSVSLTPYGYTPERASTFFDDLEGRLSGNPAIASLSLSAYQGGMTAHGQLVIDGESRKFPSTVWFTAIDERHFETLGLAVMTGRNFTPDDRDTSPRVTIVSDSFGRMLSHGGNPIGQRVTMPHLRPPAPPDVMEVVGVVPDVITNVSVLDPLMMYFPLSQHPGGTSRTVSVRAASSADAARRELMAAIRQIEPGVTPAPMLTMEERLGRQMSTQRFGAMVLGALGVIAALLTVLGTYVLAESMAVLRMREMGIRAALGARRRQLAAIVLAETGRLVGVGLIVGLFLAWMAGGAIRSFLFRVQPFDPATLGAVAAAILSLALLVSVRPAMRAARVDLGAVLKDQ